MGVEKEDLAKAVKVFLTIHIKEFLFGANKVYVVVDELTNGIICVDEEGIKGNTETPRVHNVSVRRQARVIFSTSSVQF